MSEIDPYANKKKNQNNEMRAMSHSTIPSDQGGNRTDDTTKRAEKSRGSIPSVQKQAAKENSKMGGSQSPSYGGGQGPDRSDRKTRGKTSSEKEKDDGLE
jgi:hypothetical protein